MLSGQLTLQLPEGRKIGATCVANQDRTMMLCKQVAIETFIPNAIATLPKARHAVNQYREPNINSESLYRLLALPYSMMV